MAFPGRAMFLPSGERSLLYNAMTIRLGFFFFFFNNHGLFLHPSLNQLFSSHVSSLCDSSEISVPLSAIFIFHLFIE